MKALLDRFNNDGFVVLEDIIAPEHCDILCEKMLADVAAILRRPDVPFNFNTGNIQQAPPPFVPYLFEDILFNEKIIEVTKAILGPGVKNNFYSGNTALPGEHFQPVHPDVAQLWQGLAHATPTFGVVINVPVVDMGPENGATQLWPGTHKDTHYFHGDGSARVSEEHLALWREKRPQARLGALARHSPLARGDAQSHPRAAPDDRHDPLVRLVRGLGRHRDPRAQPQLL
jgi:Phytanoyl-CoA dioxygenase (PhyH)